MNTYEDRQNTTREVANASVVSREQEEFGGVGLTPPPLHLNVSSEVNQGEWGNELTEQGYSPATESFASNVNSNQTIQLDRTEERIWYEANPNGRVSRRNSRRMILWNFPIGGSNISDFQREQLELFVPPSNSSLWLSSHPVVEVIGRASTSGSERGNLGLSLARASAVAMIIRRLLQSGQGAQHVRVESRGYGAMSPLSSNESPEGMAMNRSVEIIINNQTTIPQVPQREEKWRFAKAYLEKRLDGTMGGDSDQIWTPTPTGILKMIPVVPHIIGSSQPTWWGSEVPDRIGSENPCSQYMPEPHRTSFQSLGNMLDAEFRRNRNLSIRRIKSKVNEFIEDAHTANRRRIRRIAELNRQIHAGGGYMVMDQFRRYRAAEERYFFQDPTCVFRHIQ